MERMSAARKKHCPTTYLCDICDERVDGLLYQVRHILLVEQLFVHHTLRNSCEAAAGADGTAAGTAAGITAAAVSK
jgi:hypothetical protein